MSHNSSAIVLISSLYCRRLHALWCMHDACNISWPLGLELENFQSTNPASWAWWFLWCTHAILHGQLDLYLDISKVQVQLAEYGDFCGVHIHCGDFCGVTVVVRARSAKKAWKSYFSFVIRLFMLHTLKVDQEHPMFLKISPIWWDVVSSGGWRGRLVPLSSRVRPRSGCDVIDGPAL